MGGIIVFVVVFLPIGLVAVYIQSLFPRLLATCVSIFHCGFCLITFHGIFGLRWLCYLYIFCFQFAGHFFICACDCITIAFNFLGPRGPLVEPSMSVHPPATIFPEFIDELKHCRQASGALKPCIF